MSTALPTSIRTAVSASAPSRVGVGFAAGWLQMRMRFSASCCIPAGTYPTVWVDAASGRPTARLGVAADLGDGGGPPGATDRQQNQHAGDPPAATRDRGGKATKGCCWL